MAAFGRRGSRVACRGLSRPCAAAAQGQRAVEVVARGAVVYDFRMGPGGFDEQETSLGEGSSRQAWSDQEVDLIVADYFEMLASELAGRTVNKALRNQALQQVISRSRKSIEFKHCNISAVLQRLGLPTIKGYKPLPHFQNALVEGVERHLSNKGQVAVAYSASTSAEATVPADLQLVPPPIPSPDVEKETEKLRRLVRKFDPALRDARNRKLGRQGEELVFRYERQKLIAGGRQDLARKLEWTSEERGDGAGYDISSFDLDGSERLIEVKTTNGAALTPFYLSENERAFSDERPEAFRLLRLYNFIEGPAAFELAPPLEEWLTLRAANYRATLSR